MPETIARVPLNYERRVQSEDFGSSFLEIRSLRLGRSNWSLSLRGGRAALTSWGQGDHIWHPRGPLGCLLIVLYPSVVVKGNAAILS